jgi:hypothetical protein
MIRKTLLSRAATGAVAALVVANYFPVSASGSDDDKKSAALDLLKLSKHSSLDELKAAGVKRRAESNCSFCAWMVAGPCSEFYGMLHRHVSLL